MPASKKQNSLIQERVKNGMCIVRTCTNAAADGRCGNCEACYLTATRIIRKEPTKQAKAKKRKELEAAGLILPPSKTRKKRNALAVEAEKAGL